MASAHPAGMVHIWGRRPTRKTKLLQPRRPAFWVFTILLLITALIAVGEWYPTFLDSEISGFAFFAFGIWAAWACAIAWLVGRIDVYSEVPTSIRFGALGWGVFASLILSRPVVEAMADWVAPVFGTNAEAISTAVPEEAAKLLGVVLLAAVIPVLFKRYVGGVVCALLVAVGFSAGRGWEESNVVFRDSVATGNSGSEVLRTVFDDFLFHGFVAMPWAHFTFAVVAAMGVVYWMQNPHKTVANRVGVAVLLFFSAVVLHALTSMSTQLPDNNEVLAVVFIAVGTIVILAGIVVATLRAEHEWFSDTIRQMPPDSDMRAAASASDQHRSQSEWIELDRKKVKETRRASIAYVDAMSDHASSGEMERLHQIAVHADGEEEQMRH